MEGSCDTFGVSEFLVQRQALLAEHLCPVVIALLLMQPRGSKKCLCPHRGCHPIASRQCSLQKIPPLAEVTAYIPEVTERSPQEQGHVPSIFRLLQRPLHHRPQVVMLPLQLLQPQGLLWAP